jgi:molecular chaperone DnaJ
VTTVQGDYYGLLGVPRDADAETIRQAFYAAARAWHPDVSDAPDAEQRFRELAEAYTVLSKSSSRTLYDRYGYRGRGNNGFYEALWDAREPAPRGENVRESVVLHAFEADLGVSHVVEFSAVRACAVCNGQARSGAHDPTCPDCGGTGRVREISENADARVLQIVRCATCAGGDCRECDGTGLVKVERRLRVRIPAGISDGDQLRVGGEGNAPTHAGAPGDLLLDVRVLPAPRNRRPVRYVTLALLIATVVILVLYLR